MAYVEANLRKSLKNIMEDSQSIERTMLCADLLSKKEIDIASIKDTLAKIDKIIESDSDKFIVYFPLMAVLGLYLPQNEGGFASNNNPQVELEQSAGEMVESPLGEVLSSVIPNGPTQYVHDRDQAFQWYRQKGFPSKDHSSEDGFLWYMTMSRAAYQKGIWQEVWAGFHHALVGGLALKKLMDIPEICWQLGRAHTALGQYGLASLYLQAGQKLAEQQDFTYLSGRILLEEAVLAKLSPQSGNFQSAMERVFAEFFPSTQDLTLARKAAMTMFQEGKTSHEWRDEKNQPIKSDLIHASGFYEVSLELNRKLGDKQGIAMTLVNLGDVWQKLGKKGDALGCWREALPYLSELGDQESIGTVNRWIKDIGSTSVGTSQPVVKDSQPQQSQAQAQVANAAFAPNRKDRKKQGTALIISGGVLGGFGLLVGLFFTIMQYSSPRTPDLDRGFTYIMICFPLPLVILGGILLVIGISTLRKGRKTSEDVRCSRSQKWMTKE